MKYSWKFKLECVSKYKNGEYIKFSGTQKQRQHFMIYVREWAKAYEDLGIDGLRHSSTNKDWTPEQRFELVAKVLAGNSIRTVSKNAHISYGMLNQWVRRYNEKGNKAAAGRARKALMELAKLAKVRRAEILEEKK